MADFIPKQGGRVSRGVINMAYSSGERRDLLLRVWASFFDTWVEELRILEP
jgi:hypothetical protein